MRVKTTPSGASGVCLLIPYFNADEGLLRALASVEADALAPAVCVVDDGSRQAPAQAVLDRYRGPLDVHLIVSPCNQGIAHALNAGLAYCVPRYPYIARLDCGDCNIGRRLQDQHAYLEQHPDCALVGGWADFVAPDGTPLFTLRHPLTTAAIRRKIYLNAPFTHPAIMLRASVLADVGFYPTQYPAAEDLALFYKIVPRYAVANLPYSVVRCEVSPSGISTLQRKRQIASRIRLIVAHFDGSPMALAGLVRGLVTYCLPRRATVFVNRIRQRLRSREQGGS